MKLRQWTVAAALCALAPIAYADRFDYDWGIQIEESIAVVNSDFRCDAEGNFYVVLISRTISADFQVPYFLRKYSPEGVLLWEQKIIMYEYDNFATAKLVLGDDGAVYLEGQFDRQVTLDPDGTPISVDGFDTIPASSPDTSVMDRFIAKYTSDGDYQWLVAFGTRHSEPENGPRRMTVDAAGNIYYWSSIDHKPGPYARNLLVRRAGDPAVQTLPNPEMHTFLLKLDANGQVVWHRTYNGYDHRLGLIVQSMYLDTADRLVLTGGFSNADGFLDFDPGLGSVTRQFTYAGLYAHTWDAMIYRVTPEGEFANLGVMSTSGPDYFYDYGRDDMEREHLLTFKVSDTERKPLLYTAGTASTERGDDSYDPYGNFLGIVRLNPDGSHLDTRPIPPLVSYQSPAYRIHPYAEITKRPNLSVNGRGEYYFPYFDTRDEGATPDLYAIAKFDADLKVRWRADFLGTEGDVNGGVHEIWIGPDDAVFIGVKIEFPVDFDPTEGTDIFAPTPGQTIFVVAKITNVQTPDIASITRVNANPTNAGAIQFLVTFDEPVTGVDVGDFALTTTGAVSGASVTGVTGADAEWTVTVATGSGQGTIRLDLVDDDSIQGVQGDGLGSADAGDGGFEDGEAYTIDRSGPVATFSLLSSAYTVSNSVQVLVTFDEAASDIDPSDFAVTNGVVSGITGSGTEYIVTIQITGPGAATVDLIGGGVTDSTGNVNGPATGVSVTFLDLNGDPSVPGPAGWLMAFLGLGVGVIAWRATTQNVGRSS